MFKMYTFYLTAAEVWARGGGGSVPGNSFQGGYDNGPLYVGRVNFNNDLLPAKVQPKLGGAYSAIGNREIKAFTFDVLIGSRNEYNWVPTSIWSLLGSAKPLLNHAVVAGLTSGHGDPLYVCRVVAQRGSHSIGKVLFLL